ncbi:MAG: glycosyl hydrolase family 18 protein [Legionellaceae bacterium]|nr:glycosyl hydrolase family 18 protein [Legionellaceae bacterium]
MKKLLIPLLFFIFTNCAYADDQSTDTNLGSQKTGASTSSQQNSDTQNGMTESTENKKDGVQDANTSQGRIIGFLAGWKNPPEASALANAGYTHILIAFGVFSTAKPGEVVPVFENVSASYIKSLQEAGIKVLLSIGGASSSAPDTSVNFHQVVAEVSSPEVFTQTFVASIGSLISEYGFDGIDFDIESGLNSGGTFAQPEGDIATLASIINTLHSTYPSLLLTLAPQTANISATAGFDATWGNYSSLIMQTYQSLTWVGIKLYNSGCVFGIDMVCYDPNTTTSPDSSVAIATDLLENWPEESGGRATGFQPYVSYLKPSQVVLGYPAANAEGVSDGSPAAVISTIKRAIQCLRTGAPGATSCDTYIPPRQYPDIGGVFEWEVTYDENNNYKFAKELVNCVMNGQCTE